MTEAGAIPDPEETAVQKSRLNFPVVGIGASAGGISALQRLFGAMPAKTGMAFVVVVHLSPDHESSLDTILQRVTAMPVLAATDSVPIEADHVYLIAPSKRLSMTDGQLRVTDIQRGEARATSIDMFFRSLAHAHRERAVCVILSGTGSDGTQGLKRLKELGGVSLTQSPDDAEYNGMPRSAIDTGLVDLVLPADEIAGKLVELWRNAQRLELPAPPPDLLVARPPLDSEHLAEEALQSIKALLRERTGHNFAHYKRATVLRRLERRMQVTAVPNLPTYRRFLESHPEETQALLQDMLISVTNFFRDTEAFAALERSLSMVAESRPRTEPFRAWVAGCATGEEAYSVAITLHELLGSHGTPVQIFASDIDQRAIAVARVGVFPQSIATDVQPGRLRQFFITESRGYRIAKDVRDTVIFSAHNVLSDPPFTRMDLICCRNLLIYLDRQAQNELLRTLRFALKPEGLLFLGVSETTDGVDGLFVGEDKRHRLYRANPAAAIGRTMPALPAAPIRLPALLAAPVSGASARPPLETLHERIVSIYAPPTVLVDVDDTVLHVGDRAVHLLRLQEGAPSNKLMSLARPEIRVELRTAMARAMATGRTVQAARVVLTLNGATQFLNMSVRPATDDSSKGLFLVTFDATEETLVADETAAGDRVPVIAALEAEVLKLQEQLRASTTDSAASTEELRASNEELQTINEELRSTTEELETSREELQAVNEELTTVNSELQLKIEETSKVNDDLQNLIVSTEIGTVFVDRGLHIKRFTPPAAKLFNLLPSDVGRPLLDITHRLDYVELVDDVSEVFATLRRVEREVRGQDGAWFLVRALPYRTAEDRIDGAILTFVDVSERKAAQEELRLSEQRMRLIADSMHDYAIVTLDPSGIVTTWSPGAQRVFGYAASEIIGQTADILFTPEDRASNMPAEEMRQAREHGRAEDDRWHLRKDGKRIFCSGIMSPLIEGNLTGYAKIARDFTDGKLEASHRDAALSQEQVARGKLEEASVLKDRFLAIMSHELKNPLSIIQMNAQLLTRIPPVRGDPRAVRAAETIQSAVTSQVQIIDDLLDLSRVNMGKVTLHREAVALHELVQRIADTVADRTAAKQLFMDLNLGTPIKIMADPVRIEQIVWNLVTNAIKFTPEHGTIEVRLSVEADMARLDVRDSGVGLEPTQTESVFDMFHQVDMRTRRPASGMGIGLALVRQFAELHGGRASATSAGLGTGSTFSVWLPLDPGPISTLPVLRDASQIAGMRMLVVDDEPDLLEAFAMLLELEGAVVTVADGAKKALELATKQTFDLVVSDISMPEEDGYWLIGRIRQAPSLRSLPVIAVSGMTRRVDRQRALDASFDAHLAKPLEIGALKDAVARLTK